MRRWTINLFCLFSLLIFAGSVAIWVRSCFVTETVGQLILYEDSDMAEDDISTFWFRGVHSSYGTIGVFKVPMILLPNGFIIDHELPLGLVYQKGRKNPPFVRLNGLRLAGAGWETAVVRTSRGTYSAVEITFPIWLLLPFAIPPLLWLRRWRKNRGRGFSVEMATTQPEDSG